MWKAYSTSCYLRSYGRLQSHQGSLELKRKCGSRKGVWKHGGSSEAGRESGSMEGDWKRGGSVEKHPVSMETTYVRMVITLRVQKRPCLS